MRVLTLILALLISLPIQAESRLPFLKGIAGDHELPLPWGISFDFYTMDQQYAIDRLEFSLPGVVLSDPSLLDVDNEIQHFDIKLDVWLFPFLNVFAIYGQLDAETNVDISRAMLPLPVNSFPVEYDGDVYGGGITLAGGGEHWFASLTATFTDTSLDGGFDSSVESVTLQPRIGINHGAWQYYIGGMHLDTEEKHSGIITIPNIGVIPFGVDLSEEDEFNYAIGVHHMLSERIEFSFEIGFGDRDHTLFNIGYRF